MSRKLMTYALGFIVCGPAAFAVTFTGDVAADFAVAGSVTVLDSHDDVGLPSNAPAGTISGWDLDYAAFVLDRAAGELHIGLDFRGLAGDADGDDLDGVTTLWLAANGGLDLPTLNMSESICIAFDFDMDGTYDVITGMGGLDGTYRVSAFTGTPILPAFGFGPLIPHDGGHFYGSDLEMTLNNMGVLANLDPTVELCFRFLFFAGSFQDDGIGEDLLLGEVCLPPDELVSALQPEGMNLVSAYPNPFNPTTTLSVELGQTGPVQLSVYNVNGQLVQTLVDGMMESGRHELGFNGAALSSGIYLARLSTVGGEQVTRLVLTK
jgi:hypothetical protein